MVDRNLLAVTDVEIKSDNPDDVNLLQVQKRIQESPAYKAMEDHLAAGGYIEPGGSWDKPPRTPTVTIPWNNYTKYVEQEERVKKALAWITDRSKEIDEVAMPVSIEDPEFIAGYWAAMKAIEYILKGETVFGTRGEKGSLLVSTIFLSFNHRYDNNGPPLLLEMMVFPDDGWNEIDCERYSTWEDAEAGHARMVAKAEKYMETGEWPA